MPFWIIKHSQQPKSWNHICMLIHIRALYLVVCVMKTYHIDNWLLFVTMATKAPLEDNSKMTLFLNYIN